MLVEIQCDSFKQKEPIKFKEGLNVVLGAEDGANSIGKSTLLMIIDFVLGGSDYTSKSLDTIKNVGEHKINFCFQFEDELFYFSRHTKTPNEIIECDEQYHKIQSMDLTSYTNLLKKKYNIQSEYITFRDAVSNFIRVYHRDNHDENAPLSSFKNETQNKGIKRLFKLFNAFEEIDFADKRHREYKEKKITYNKSLQYDYIYATPNKTEYKKNEKKLSDLIEHKESLVNDLGESFTGLDEYQRNNLSNLREQQRMISSRLLNYQLQLNSIKQDQKFSSVKLKNDLMELEKFMPNIDIETIANIENFHNNLNSILKKQVADNRKNIRSEMKKYSNILDEVAIQIKEIKGYATIPQDKLKNYTDVDREIIKLEKANEAFDRKNLIAEETKIRKNQLDAIVDRTIDSLETQLNTTMNSLNERITDGQKSSPVMNISSISKYNFEVPNDSGTGTNFRGLVIFDLALLELTFLPLLVHDSLIFKQVEDNAIENILNVYKTMNKQTFIAFDKQDAYTDNVKEILIDNTVIQLGPNQEALFGKTWSNSMK